jgi:hypothetical protein
MMLFFRDVPFDFYNRSNMSIQHRQTSDAKFVEIGGLEIGAEEIKPFNTEAADIDGSLYNDYPTMELLYDFSPKTLRKSCRRSTTYV